MIQLLAWPKGRCAFAAHEGPAFETRHQLWITLKVLLGLCFWHGGRQPVSRLAHYAVHCCVLYLPEAIIYVHDCWLELLLLLDPLLPLA